MNSSDRPYLIRNLLCYRTIEREVSTAIPDLPFATSPFPPWAGAPTPPAHPYDGQDAVPRVDEDSVAARSAKITLVHGASEARNRLFEPLDYSSFGLVQFLQHCPQRPSDPGLDVKIQTRFGKRSGGCQTFRGSTLAAIPSPIFTPHFCQKAQRT